MSASEPGKIITPWAESGLKNAIPPAANPATGRAGFDQGFSAINMTAKEAGGIPPFGQDFNGIFYEVTNILRYMQAGGQPTFDASLATAIGGYPKGAVILGSDGETLWQSQISDNGDDPDIYADNWLKVDVNLRQDLSDFPTKIAANGLGSTAHYGEVIIGDNPMGNVGDDWPNPVGLRDAINISRKISSEPTNCHAFADKTIIDGPTDLGQYGTFDSTPTVTGSGNQEHLHSFQDRTIFSGTGLFSNMSGLYSRPEHRGSGTISVRRGAFIEDIYKTGAGAVTDNIGVWIGDLANGVRNVALNIQQTTGYAYYAPGGASFYHVGKMGINIGDPASDLTNTFNFKGAGAMPRGFLDSDTSNGAALGVDGDNPISLVSNGAIRWRLRKQIDGWSWAPGQDNVQPLGLASARCSVIYAGSGTINTSDEREKTFFEISNAEKEVAVELKRILRKFKFNDAVLNKGADKARYHFGVGAQSVAKVFEDHGLHAEDYALFCYDEWGETDDGPAGSRYGIRYDELLAFIISAI